MTLRAEKVAYRFIDQRYSIPDEYGDHAYTSHQVIVRVYPIIRETPCGIWIAENLWESYPRVPVACDWERSLTLGRRFVNLQANKKFALPTLEEAYESYQARKQREIRIYNARISGANMHLGAAKEWMFKNDIRRGRIELFRDNKGNQNIPS